MFQQYWMTQCAAKELPVPTSFHLRLEEDHSILVRMAAWVFSLFHAGIGEPFNVIRHLYHGTTTRYSSPTGACHK